MPDAKPVVSADLPAWPREEVPLAGRTLAARHAPGAEPGLPAAVLLHGLGGSSLNWTDFMTRMRSELDSWSVDLGGFGGSPPPRDGDVTPAGHARAIAEFVEHLDRGPVHLFGNSLGGAVAVQLAARRPDLVQTLTLVSPALPAAYATRGNVHLPVVAIPGVGERLIQRYLRADAEARVRGTLSVTLADPSRLPAIRVQEATAEVRAHERLPYATEAFTRSLRGLLRTYLDRGPDRPWRLAERIACPTLLVYGRKDPLVDSRTAYRATRHFLDAHVVVLPDCGHVAQMEHPEFVAAAWERFCRPGSR